jgi:hypothetical protein
MRPAILLGSLLLFVGTGPLLAESAEPLSVDYVIGMLQAGMSQEEVVSHIRDNELTFIIRKGDVDRLLDAGAGEDLLMTVLKGSWSRPRRLDSNDAEKEGVAEEDGYDDGPAYRGYFYFGWPGYYYDPWYYGYYGYGYPRYSYYYYYPYGGHYGYYGHHGGRGHYGYGRHGHSVAPRGSPRRHHVAAPRGSPRGRYASPRGGGRSSGSRGVRGAGRAPRGSR